MISILQSYSTMLFRALGYTLVLTVLALIFAMIIGLIFALMNVSHSRILNIIGTVYVDAIRGVPLIVLAFFIYFGVPQAFKMMGFTSFRLPALQAGTIALAMNCGAYMAEIFRAGIESIDKGQMEASRSLGLTYGTSMKCVILPQAFKVMIPSIINQFIITLLLEPPDLGYSGCSVHGGHCLLEQGCKADRAEDQDRGRCGQAPQAPQGPVRGGCHERYNKDSC